jgi:hypothetical protein
VVISCKLSGLRWIWTTLNIIGIKTLPSANRRQLKRGTGGIPLGTTTVEAFARLLMWLSVKAGFSLAPLDFGLLMELDMDSGTENHPTLQQQCKMCDPPQGVTKGAL